jgi:hypothetical protein
MLACPALLAFTLAVLVAGVASLTPSGAFGELLVAGTNPGQRQAKGEFSNPVPGTGCQKYHSHVRAYLCRVLLPFCGP